MLNAKPVEKIKSRQQISNDLKARVAAIADKLPTNYIQIILLHYPKYDTIQGGQLINNVKRQRSYDAELTEILERIAKKKLTLSTKREEFLIIE